MADAIFIGIPIPSGKIAVKKITSDEDLALKVYADTDDANESSRISGVTKQSLQTLLEDEDIKYHIINIRLLKLKSSAVNPDRVKSIINDSLLFIEKKLNNGQELSRDNITLLSLACDVAGTKNQKIDINVRKIEGSFASMSDEELDKLIDERKSYIEYRKNLEEDIRVEKIKIPGLTKGISARQ